MRDSSPTDDSASNQLKNAAANTALKSKLRKDPELRKRLKRQSTCDPIKGPMKPPARNSPCPCGSGKKFKKCCRGVVIHDVNRKPKLENKWNFEQIKERALYAEQNNGRLVYSTFSPWWFILARGDEKLPYYLKTSPCLPCDPRGAVLLETTGICAFIDAAEQNVEHYGRHGIEAFVAAYHENVVERDGMSTSLNNWDEYNNVIDVHKEMDDGQGTGSDKKALQDTVKTGV